MSILYRVLEAHESTRHDDADRTRRVRPSPKPGYRWADAGEWATVLLHGDEVLPRARVLLQYSVPDDAGHVVDGKPLGAIVSWPQDPRLARA